MMYGNGDIYEGSWANDKKHGSGSHFYINKVILRLLSGIQIM